LSTVDREKGWSSLADAGLLALRVRDSDGRPMASGVEVMLVAEALGGYLAPLPYVGSGVLAQELLELVDGPDSWRTSLSSGDARYALLLSPDLSGLAAVDQPTEALAWDADGASHALALSDRSDSPKVVRIALGDSWTPVSSVDLTRVMRRHDSVGGEEIDEAGRPLTLDQRDHWLALALTSVSADAVGAMRKGLEDVVAYTKVRVQYGVPIGSFQAVQHLCAEAFVLVEAAASTVKYAAWGIDELAPGEALMAARIAKAYGAAITRSVPETIMQVYGGIGQTWEHIAHFVNRRAMLDRQLFGNDEAQLDAIAEFRLEVS
jgi:alkylation response protein AidB-like acyl-CoA dehydrogenase